jgi:hypothetical protein
MTTPHLTRSAFVGQGVFGRRGPESPAGLENLAVRELVADLLGAGDLGARPFRQAGVLARARDVVSHPALAAAIALLLADRERLLVSGDGGGVVALHLGDITEQRERVPFEHGLPARRVRAHPAIEN